MSPWPRVPVYLIFRTNVVRVFPRGQRAAVDAAGGSESWQADYVAQELATAVRHAVAPIFFFEPMNDVSIDATIYLSRIAGHNCRQYQAALFPALNTHEDSKLITAGVTKVDYDTVAARQKAHGITMSHPEVWGAPVVEFLDRHLANPYVLNNNLCVETSHKPD